MKNDLICELAIKKTLAYSAIFNFPISLYRLHMSLITADKVDLITLFSSLKSLEERKIIKEKRARYMLLGSTQVDWLSRKNQARKFLNSNQQVFKALGFIPWLRYLGVTGTVAFDNCSKKDDIDVFIITSSKRLWITRFFVVTLLKVLNAYRTPKNSAGKICPNLFITEDNLAWEKKEQNIFVAHEIFMMKPVINKDFMYFKFLSANDWIFDFFCNARDFYLSDSFLSARYCDVKTMSSCLMNFVELIFEKFQLFYMKHKRTTEVTSKVKIHFKKTDNSEDILKKYKKINSHLAK